MSEGELCGGKIKVTTSKNSEAGIVCRCSGWPGHTGKHVGSLYHVKQEKGNDWLTNFHVGKIEWDDEMTK